MGSHQEHPSEGRRHHRLASTVPLWYTVKDDCFGQLNELCNIDKHQIVAVGCIEFQIRIDGVSSAWRKDLKHTIVISVPIAEKSNLQADINVPGVVFGEPIETTDTVSDFEITLDRLGEIYRLVRYDVVPKFAGIFQQEIASNLAESQRVEPPGKADPEGKRWSQPRNG